MRQLSMNLLCCENCINTMARLPSESVDMVLTSPPYDNLRTYNGYSFDFPTVASELVRIIRPGRCIVWIVGDSTINGNETGTSFKQALYFKELGLNLHDTMFYRKNSPAYPASPRGNRYTQAIEYMFVFSKGKPIANLICDKPNKWAGHTDYSGKQQLVRPYGVRENIWAYATSKNSTGHPAPFPLELAEDHIRTWTNPGELVYDPFMGSGTTWLACKNLNRRWLGSEISGSYCNLQMNRYFKKCSSGCFTIRF